MVGGRRPQHRPRPAYYHNMAGQLRPAALHQQYFQHAGYLGHVDTGHAGYLGHVGTGHVGYLGHADSGHDGYLGHVDTGHVGYPGHVDTGHDGYLGHVDTGHVGYTGHVESGHDGYLGHVDNSVDTVYHVTSHAAETPASYPDTHVGSSTLSYYD